MHWRVRLACGALASLAVCSGYVPRAQAYSLLPLVTETAQPLPSGVAEAVLGVSYFHDLRYPFFTPGGVLRRLDLLQLPHLEFHIGAGGWVEIQAAYDVLYLDEETSTGLTNWQYGSGDIRLFTKVRLLGEAAILPAVGLRFGTKLPNANRENQLGTDAFDFGADVLVSKDFGLLAADVNLGLVLLDNPGSSITDTFAPGGQDDLFDYAVAVVSAPLGDPQPGAVALRLLGEITGLTGSRFDNDRASARAGIQMTRGPATLYLGVSAGLVTGSEHIGASTGVIYTFEPAKLLEDW
jgi:hypothetical protein